MGLETALIASAVAGTAAAAAQGVGQYQQAKATEASAQFDADLQAQNARIARQEAGEAEDLQRRRARVALSSQRATAAERGLDFASSSAWDLYRQSAIDAEADALAIRRKGEMQARGSQMQAATSRFAAKQAGTAALIGAGASALSVGGAAADGYGDYQLLTAGRATPARRAGAGV